MEDLKEWMLTYLKNRDLHEKFIVGFEQRAGFDFVVKRSDQDVFVIVRSDLQDVKEIVEKGAGKKLCVVTLNKRGNVGFLVKNWQELKSLKGLCFYFVNLDSGDRWILYPYTHDLVTEASALKKGLEGLYASIEDVKA